MKAIVRKAISLAIGMASVGAVCTMSVSAYYKASYERSFSLYTYSSAYAPDLTSYSSDVTMPATADGMDFYCTQFSGSSYAQMKLTKSTLVDTSQKPNQANLHYQYEDDRVPFVSDWQSKNNGSRIVAFTATMKDANVNNNAYISVVAW